jgi:hypothetical protein
MSGDSGEYTPEELLGLGATHFFPKPFTDWGGLQQALWEMAEGELCGSR